MGSACVRSSVVYLLLSLYIVCVGPPALAIAVLFRRPALPVVLGVVAVRLARWILGIRCRVEGLAHVVGDRPAVYCLMAIAAQVPIVPIAIRGGRAAMPKRSALVRPVVPDACIGPPIETSGMTADDRDRLMAGVRARMETMLASR